MNVHTPARARLILLSTAVTAVLVGCASVPRQDAQLEVARSAVTAAHADSRVTGDARTELAKADAALSTADALMTTGKPLSDVDFQAYLADRYARTAQAQGAVLDSERRTAELDNRRNAVLLAARDGDVRRANAVAASMTLDARAARSDAAASAMVADVRTQEAIDARSDAALSAVDTATANERAARLQLQLTDLQGVRTDRGLVVTLGDVLFASGHSELQEGSQRSINKLTTFLADYPQRTVRVEGFTDSTGGDDYNRRLSERRAESVSDALARAGVDRGRIQTEGYGNAYAVAGNNTVIGRQQNRRVEVIISDNDQPVADRTH
jgi:outer membrane protein OmpA-like peptidoglycan-associated protein